MISFESIVLIVFYPIALRVMFYGLLAVAVWKLLQIVWEGGCLLADMSMHFSMANMEYERARSRGDVHASKWRSDSCGHA